MADNLNVAVDLEEIVPLDEQETEEDLEGKISFKHAISQSADWTLETINSQLVKGNIDLDPEFQRRAAWDDTRKSRLIESIIVGMPVPNIVIAESKERGGSFIVIDGKQRLISIHDYYANQYTLRGLDIRGDLNGLRYSELPTVDRNSLDNSTLRTTLIKHWQDENFLYTIFFRLNSGSLPLSPQELRKALVGGRLLDRIEHYIGESTEFHNVFGIIPDRRMRDSELILRFVAFDVGYSKYNGNLKLFLDDTAASFEADNRQEELGDCLNRLNIVLETTWGIFGRGSFKKWTGSGYERRMNRAIFDCIARFFSDEEVAGVATLFKDAVRDQFHILCEDANFREAIERTTKTKEATRYRVNAWGTVLAGIVGGIYDNVNARIKL